MLGKTNAARAMNPIRNVTVIGGKTKPENPLKRTVWVDTDIPINDYLISAMPTDIADKVEGLLLISSDGDSFMNVDLGKYRSIEMTFGRSFVYHETNWIQIPAWYYDDEKWTEFSKISKVLLNITDTTIDKTIFGPVKNTTFASHKVGTEYGIKATNSSKTVDSIVQFKEPVDFNMYRTLHVKLLHSGTSKTFTFGVASKLSETAVSNTDIFDLAKLDATVDVGGSGEFDIDVTSLTTTGYVGFATDKNTYKTLQVVSANA